MDETTIPGPSGPLELLYSLPPPPESSTSSDHPPPLLPPLLFVHGARCSARDYMFLLPYLARHCDVPAYAVSVRGHGASQHQAFLTKLLFTTVDSWAQDILAALRHVAAHHPDRPAPVLGGHSLGGGFVQYMADAGYLTGTVPTRSSSTKRRHRSRHRGQHMPLHKGHRSRDGHAVNGAQNGAKPDDHPDKFTNNTDPTTTKGIGSSGSSSSLVSGLILLAAAPLSGRGSEINSNWIAIEKAGGFARHNGRLGPRTKLLTTAHVRALFFSKATDDATIRTWIDRCKTPDEGAVAGLRCFRKMGDYATVLGSVKGFVVVSGGGGGVGAGAGGGGDASGGSGGGLATVAAKEEEAAIRIDNSQHPLYWRQRRKRTRKILFVAADHDGLVTPEMVETDFKAYKATARKMAAAAAAAAASSSKKPSSSSAAAAAAAANGHTEQQPEDTDNSDNDDGDDGDDEDDNETCMHLVIEQTGHHVMMDTHWEKCARGIARWLTGEAKLA